MPAKSPKPVAPFIIFGREGGHPNYKKNVDKAKLGGFPCGPEECCVYCGKASGVGPFAVFLSDIGEEADPEAPESKIDCLGYYPMGSTCAKLARKAGWKVYERDENGHYQAPKK